jgi:hypothetical protein
METLFTSTHDDMQRRVAEHWNPSEEAKSSLEPFASRGPYTTCFAVSSDFPITLAMWHRFLDSMAIDKAFYLHSHRINPDSVFHCPVETRHRPNVQRTFGFPMIAKR